MASPCQASGRSPPSGLALGLHAAPPRRTRRTATPPGGFSAAPDMAFVAALLSTVFGGRGSDSRPFPGREILGRGPASPSRFPTACAIGTSLVSPPLLRAIAVPAPRETARRSGLWVSVAEQGPPG